MVLRTHAPRGMNAVGIFLFFGSLMAFLAGTTLVWKGTPFDRMWALNAPAYERLAPFGAIIGIPFLLLSATLVVAGIGWRRRRLWGWWLAVAIIATQIFGFFFHFLLGLLFFGVLGVLFFPGFLAGFFFVGCGRGFFFVFSRMTPSGAVEFLVWLLIAAAIIAMLAKVLRIPYTVSLVCGGLVLGAIHLPFFSPLQPGHRPDWLTPDVILILFLPALVFEGSVKLDVGSCSEMPCRCCSWLMRAC